ncbi:MAG: HAMP domain-containing sensor histidine kinase [Actinomycetota bacterium]
MRALADTAAAGWPLAASLGVAIGFGRVRAGRRRTALNRALHELRRPLQALALAIPGARAAAGTPAPLDLAIAALADLEREINGGGPPRPWQPVSCRELLGAAVGRWRGRARLAGGTIELRWRAGAAAVVADPARISQAVDNLIVNALQHGGPHVAVEARLGSGRLRIVVADDGSAARPAGWSDSPGQVIARLTGRRRHGHGLAVVREVAAEHGGRFALHRSEQGSVAVLELPLAGAGNARAA